jgi:pimeloyl-ACP methyl ester carboxylesterase
LLLDVTAFISTSAIATAVAGAFGVPTFVSEPVVVAPEIAVVSSLDASTLAVLTGPDGPFYGMPSPFAVPASSAATSESLAQLDGVTLLGQLSLLPRTRIAEFAAEHPDKVAALLTSPPPASEVSAWWADTPIASRGALSVEIPMLVGNLEGLPYVARDLANRRLLSQTVDEIGAKLEAGVGRAARDDLEKRRYMLGEVRRALETGVSGETRTLLGLDVAGEGRAVIGIGDVGGADHVTFLVPGMFYGVATQLVDWADTSDEFLAEQKKWIERLDPDERPTVAAVAWIGYHTPSLVTVASLELAREGQAALTSSLQGLEAERGDSQPYVSVIAHSYGSTAVMLSLQEDDVQVDALAIVGSPGSPASSAAELSVRNGNVWVGAADWDPIPGSGVFGSQPLSTEYGAHRFAVSSMADPVSGASLGDSLSHNDYFSAGSSSMRNMTLIALGRGDLVLGTDGSLALGAARAVSR